MKEDLKRMKINEKEKYMNTDDKERSKKDVKTRERERGKEN